MWKFQRDLPGSTREYGLEGQEATYKALIVIWILDLILYRSMMLRSLLQLSDYLEGMLNVVVTAGDNTH